LKINARLIDANYFIVNTLGRIVSQGTLNEETSILHLENIPSGIYSLNIQGHSSIKISKR
jgi:hypothetical protein